MKKATVSVFIDSYHPKNDGKCAVSIKVTSQRKKKYYKMGIDLEKDGYKVLKDKERKNDSEREIYNKINSFESKANAIVDKLEVFTFSKFEDMFLENRDATDSIKAGFDKYVKELKQEDRIGTAVSYECAINSIEQFQKGLKYADITKSLLKKYEKWMLDNGKSKTTVGIYLRSLRAIFNTAMIDKSLYPFGERKDQYSIPTGRNIKKALTLEEVSRIYNYVPPKGTTIEMAIDYWLFIYLCNGINVKDLCLLKWKNIDGNILKYERAKTMRSKKESTDIVVSLKPRALEVIKKWGVPSINSECYVFPHLQIGLTAVRERKIYQQLTKTINKYMKLIAKEVDINKPATTYVARHSYASVLRNSGASEGYISEALGHSSIKTTQSYLAGFEVETIHKTTDALTNFKKQA